MRWRWIVAAVVVLVVGGGLGVGVVEGANWIDDSQTRRADAAYEAAHPTPTKDLLADAEATDRKWEAACEKVMNDRLVAPVTARYSNGHFGEGGDPYKADGTRHEIWLGDVDSQNSYGALVRSTWRCDLTVDGSNDVVTATITQTDQRGAN